MKEVVEQLSGSTLFKELSDPKQWEGAIDKKTRATSKKHGSHFLNLIHTISNPNIDHNDSLFIRDSVYTSILKGSCKIMMEQNEIFFKSCTKSKIIIQAKGLIVLNKGEGLMLLSI